MAVFRRQAQATYDDARGSKRGVSVVRVANSGDFTLVLSQASKLPSFSSTCSAQWSCRVGRYVVINQRRWLPAEPVADPGRAPGAALQLTVPG